MSFIFNWTFFDETALIEKAKKVLKSTMNRGSKPEMIVGSLDVSTLNLGTVPPNIEILEIGDLGDDKFRGIFKLEYCGDASLAIQTKVHANPLTGLLTNGPRFVVPSIVAAAKSLELPLTINISEMKLSAIIIVVYSQSRGLTVVFQNDPLQAVKVESTFDFVPAIASFIQREIEARLRESLRDDLPEVLYQLSQDGINNYEATASINRFLASHPRPSPRLATTPCSPLPKLDDFFPVRPPTASVQDIQRMVSSTATLGLNSIAGPVDCVSRSTVLLYEQDHHDTKPDHSSIIYRSRSVAGSIDNASSPLSELTKVLHCEDNLSPQTYKGVRPRRRLIKLHKGPSPPSVTPPPRNSPRSCPGRHYSTPPQLHTPKTPSSQVLKGSTDGSRHTEPHIKQPTPIHLDFRSIMDNEKKFILKQGWPETWVDSPSFPAHI